MASTGLDHNLAYLTETLHRLSTQAPFFKDEAESLLSDIRRGDVIYTVSEHPDPGEVVHQILLDTLRGACRGRANRISVNFLVGACKDGGKKHDHATLSQDVSEKRQKVLLENFGSLCMYARPGRNLSWLSDDRALKHRIQALLNEAGTTPEDKRAAAWWKGRYIYTTPASENK